MAQRFLNKVYETRSPAETRELYDEWSGTYEAEVRENGYVTPVRCAEVLAQHVDDQTTPILDFGCGTGLSGLAFKLAGFEVIDGMDISSEMIEVARRKRLYRALKVVPAHAPARIERGRYAAIAAVGVIGAGAAPASTFDVLMQGLAPGGKLVLSLNDHALQEKANEGRICEWMDCGAARLLCREHGPHLPGLGIQSTVYVIERA